MFRAAPSGLQQLGVVSITPRSDAEFPGGVPPAVRVGSAHAARAAAVARAALATDAEDAGVTPYVY